MGSRLAAWAAPGRLSSGTSSERGEEKETGQGMAGESSFDVVSDFDQQGLGNALDQVRREIATRYDFKGSRSTLELGKTEVTLQADDEFRAKAVRDLGESEAARRGLSLKVFDWG